MTTKSILTPCVPRKMPKTTDISLIQICLQSISLMHGLKRLKQNSPELREVKQARYQEEYGLPAYDAGILTESRHLAGLFEETAAIYGNAKKTANWFMGEVLRLTKDKAMDPEQVSSHRSILQIFW